LYVLRYEFSGDGNQAWPRKKRLFQTEELKQKQLDKQSLACLITAGDSVFVCWIEWMTDVI
jgi:hypothetical protein